jgi:hypothetical protein
MAGLTRETFQRMSISTRAAQEFSRIIGHNRKRFFLINLVSVCTTAWIERRIMSKSSAGYDRNALRRLRASAPLLDTSAATLGWLRCSQIVENNN